MKKIRQDVWRIAENLAAAADLDADSVYAWMHAVGKHFGTNPKNLDFRTGTGRITLASDPDGFYLEKFRPRAAGKVIADYGTDYEGLILARQENLD